MNLHWMRLLMIAAVLLLGGCASSAGLPVVNEPSLLNQAEREATAIIEKAQATSLVLQAQAQATAVMQQMATLVDGPANQDAFPTAGPGTPYQERPDDIREATRMAATQTVVAMQPPEDGPVEIVQVALAAEGGFIMVQFRAPKDEAAKWWQGSVSVTDEATGTVYAEVPVMPKIGLLISRPQFYGQVGNIMFTNLPVPLEAGALVTVRLGEYIFEHLELH